MFENNSEMTSVRMSEVMARRLHKDLGEKLDRGDTAPTNVRPSYRYDQQ